MSDDIWTRDEIDSPCQKICLIHPDAEICIGCHRSRSEIADWSLMSPDQRQAIAGALPDRARLFRRNRRARSVQRR